MSRMILDSKKTNDCKTVSLIEEILSDGSKVYDVEIADGKEGAVLTMFCDGPNAASLMYETLLGTSVVCFEFETPE